MATEKLEEVLSFCMICKKIKISGDPEVWVSEEDNKEMYQDFMREYEGRLSHGYCPECYLQVMKEYGLD